MNTAERRELTGCVKGFTEAPKSKETPRSVVDDSVVFRTLRQISREYLEWFNKSPADRFSDDGATIRAGISRCVQVLTGGRLLRNMHLSVATYLACEPEESHLAQSLKRFTDAPAE